MSIVVNVNGESINYPQTGDTNWGDEATDFAVQTSSAFAKVGLSTGTTVDLPGTLDVTGNTTLDANLSVGGNASITGNTTLTGNLTVNGNTQLGNANTDTIGVTGIVNIDSGVLYVDPTNNRVGINKTSPAQALDVVGDVAISGNETIAGTLGISNGTASAPSLTPSGDTNTGLYSIGADKIGFSANGIRQGEFGVGYGGFTGNVIQVVIGELTTRQQTASTAFVDTGLSATITPKYTTSKILVIFNCGATAGNASNGIFYNLVRGSTNIAQSTGGLTANQTGWYYVNNSEYPAPISISTLDSPNTTSSTTYKIQFRGTAGTLVTFNGRTSSADYPGYSSLILMEIQQ